MVWLAGRLVLDGASDVAEAAVRSVLRYSTMSEEQHRLLRAELKDQDGTLLPSLVDALMQLRALLQPVVNRTRIQRITPERAANILPDRVEADLPTTAIDALQAALLSTLRFAGEYGREQAESVKNLALSPEPDAPEGTSPPAEQYSGLAAEWVGPEAAERVWFSWPQSQPVRPDESTPASFWSACCVPDPASCRALRRLVLALWFRIRELEDRRPSAERFPHATLPVAIIQQFDTWRTHVPELTTEGLILRSIGGAREGSFPGLDPRIAERLVDDPGVLAGLTVRRLLRALPRMAWIQAINGVNPYNRLVFQGLQGLGVALDIKDKTTLQRIPDILRAGQEWRRGRMDIPPLWQVWMPDVMPRGRNIAEIRVDVGEGLCPGYVAPSGLHSRDRWILPVLDLPVLLAVDPSRRAALENLQWALLFELRVSAACGNVVDDMLILTEGQKLQAADRAGVTREELRRALEGYGKAAPWLAQDDAPGSWLIDCGEERVRLTEPGAQRVLLMAAERAETNRERHSFKR